MPISRKIQFAGVIGLSVTSCLASPIRAGAQAGATAAQERNATSEATPRAANENNKAKELENVEGRVTTIIHEHLGVPLSQIKPDASLMKDLGAESLDVIELVMAFEEEFSIEIPDTIGCDWATKSCTVGDVFRTIKGCNTESSGSLSGCSRVPAYPPGTHVHSIWDD